MKSKNIPADIRSKTSKEAQSEIKEIISSLESSEKSLQESIEKYNRMMHLNNYIQEQFREKSKEISNSNVSKKIL
jgi:exonuclease VII small subunit